MDMCWISSVVRCLRAEPQASTFDQGRWARRAGRGAGTEMSDPVTWVAEMISSVEELAGAPLFRREFSLDSGHGAVLRAWLHISSLGVFEAFINDEAVGEDVLSPGWSSYEWRLRY